MTYPNGHVTKITKEHAFPVRQLQVVGYKTAVIAGGAVRDSYFQKPIRDIDIFYFHDRHSSEKVVSGFDRLEESKVAVEKLFDLNLTTSYDDHGFFMLEDYIRVLYTETKQSKKSKKSYGYGSRFVSSVVEFQKNEQVYQIIGLKISPNNYIMKHFDLDLCRCWSDGVRLRYTSQFLRDAKAQTMTISGQLTKHEYDYCQRHHIPKLRHKYPNFGVVDMLKGRYNP